jgi:pimeloyl-ACP methyl ester carboxylesterase
MGGYLSLLYSLRHPARVRGLVLINPLYSAQQLRPLLQAVRRRPRVGEKALRHTPEWLMNLLLGWDPSKPADFPPEARRQIANDYKRASPHIIYITRSIPDLTPWLSRVSAPTQLIWGEKDHTLQPASFRRLAQLIPGAAALSIPGCGHQPHIGQPDLVNRQTLEFLGSLG